MVRWIVVVFVLTSLMASDAAASRYHVASFGERTSGASNPGDWSAANCYPSLAAASFMSSLGDSILLFDEIHQLDQQITLSRFLGNAALDNNPGGAQVACGPLAQMDISEQLPGFLARGITFQGNGVDSDHAAFLCSHGLNGVATIQFEYCHFQSLTGSNQLTGSGSCINAWGDGRGTTVVIANCRFEDNSARGIGGAMFFGNGYDIQISSTEFLNNHSLPGPDGSVGSGGALAVASKHHASSITCTNTFFSGNKSWGPGGTIYVADASLTLVDTELSDSASAVDQSTYWSAGAGIMSRRTDGSHLESTIFQVEGCLFQRNIGEIVDNPYAGDGGAILVRGSDDRVVEVTVRNSDFLDNYNSQGAGLYVGRFANALVEYCRFIGNRSFMQGGATYKGGVFEENEGEVAVYKYCDFINNQTGVFFDGTDSTDFGRGGAFSMRFFTRAEFHNCTFYNNSAHGPAKEGHSVMLPNEGYEFDSDDQRCDFINTVFYGDQPWGVEVATRPGAIGRMENCAFEEGQVQLGGIEPVDSVLLEAFPFTDTQDFNPGVDSPLIDAGQDWGQTHDLSGSQVPYGPAPDIGAYEAHYATSTVSTGGLPVGLTLRGWPNPFSGTAQFRFALPEPDARIDIYDIAGRKVRTVRADKGAGDDFSASWDARDENGRPQPAGIYLCRVRGRNSDLTLRLILIR